MMMDTNTELKRGWLNIDLDRASKRVQELKIAKSKFSELVDEDAEEKQIEDTQTSVTETLQC
jgi:hypothetical protein